MKAWIKRILGSPGDPQSNGELNALDNYVVVQKEALDELLDELQELRSLNMSTDARDLDLLLGHSQAENKKLKMDIEILTQALRDATMNHRE